MTSTSTTTIARRYLDTKEAAVYLGTTAAAVYAAVARRQIPVRRKINGH